MKMQILMIMWMTYIRQCVQWPRTLKVSVMMMICQYPSLLINKLLRGNFHTFSLTRLSPRFLLQKGLKLLNQNVTPDHHATIQETV